jgi:hypothetical protein
MKLTLVLRKTRIALALPWFDLSVEFGYFGHLYLHLGPGYVDAKGVQYNYSYSFCIDTVTCNPYDTARFFVSASTQTKSWAAWASR